MVGREEWQEEPETLWQSGSREIEQEVRPGYKPSMSILSDVLPPARLFLLKIS